MGKRLSQTEHCINKHMKPRSTRYYLDHLVKVFDCNTNSEIGYLLDISETGIAMMCNHKLERSRKHSIRILNYLDDEKSEFEYIDIIAVVRRFSKNNNLAKCLAGLSYSPANIKSKIRMIRFLSKLKGDALG